jgi:hypothetical protein
LPEKWLEAQRLPAQETALRANDAYLDQFVEGHNLCPYAREGRRRGETHRHVQFQTTTDLEQLLVLFERSVADPTCVVMQVIFPDLDVDPAAWIEFCHHVTKLGHLRRGGPDVMANAALHPRLTYHQATPYALIPLFRRAPDPTIQWVRLTHLEKLYEGRAKGSTFIDPTQILDFLQAKVSKSLYDRVAETNQQTALKLGVENLEQQLHALYLNTQANYRRLGRRDSSCLEAQDLLPSRT